MAADGSNVHTLAPRPRGPSLALVNAARDLQPVRILADTAYELDAEMAGVDRAMPGLPDHFQVALDCRGERPVLTLTQGSTVITLTGTGLIDLLASAACDAANRAERMEPRPRPDSNDAA